MQVLVRHGEYTWADDRLGRILWDAQWIDTPDTRQKARGILKYGITPSEYERMMFAQDWSCGGCNQKFADDGRGVKIDHCHTTGAVRGLLCNRCNVALGWARDNPDTLARLATYLKKEG